MIKKATSRSGAESVWQVAILLVFIGLIIVATVLMIVFATRHLESDGISRPEIILPLVVITGVVALLATLAIAAATFGIFNISDSGQALGLPAGSIQAVIALSLILIFAVVALYASGRAGNEQIESTGLTAEQFEAIPPKQIVSSRKTKTDGGVEYTVVRSIENPGARDINTQLLTTVSTLVVAVAGFYFGSKSAQEGGATALEAAGAKRTLNVTNPTSPHRLPQGEQLAGITLQTVPSNAAVRWSVQGDSEGGLAREEDGTYRYSPGSKMSKGQSATLYFEQVDDPNASDALTVTIGEKVKPTPVKTSKKTGKPKKPKAGKRPSTRRAPTTRQA